MIEIISVSIGGFFGAIFRYTVSSRFQNKAGIPVATLIVNLSGAFLLGMLMGMQIKGNLYLLFGTGFMGAFTTFSTFKLESERLRKEKNRRGFFSYLAISYVFGITLAFCGLMLGKLI